MPDAVIFATGSAVVVEVEESLARAGLSLAAGLRNREGMCWLSDPARSLSLAEAAQDLRALPVVVPLFTPANRMSAVAEARGGFARFLSLIDPSAVLPRALTHGEGLYVNAGTTIGAAGRLGAFVFINRGASVGHHLTCGHFVSIGPGAVLAGQVTVGDGTLIGAGAVVLPQVTIGAEAVVAAGSVVARDVPDGATVAGNPARVVRRGEA